MRPLPFSLYNFSRLFLIIMIPFSLGLALAVPARADVAPPAQPPGVNADLPSPTSVTVLPTAVASPVPTPLPGAQSAVRFSSLALSCLCLVVFLIASVFVGVYVNRRVLAQRQNHSGRR